MFKSGKSGGMVLSVGGKDEVIMSESIEWTDIPNVQIGRRMAMEVSIFSLHCCMI
jgi:hypothetical protein